MYHEVLLLNPANKQREGGGRVPKATGKAQIHSPQRVPIRGAQSLLGELRPIPFRGLAFGHPRWSVEWQGEVHRGPPFPPGRGKPGAGRAREGHSATLFHSQPRFVGG